MTESHRWYVVHVYSGNEKKVAQYVREQAEKKGISEQISEVLVPSEEVVEIRRGVKTNTEKKIFPGYILVHMHLTDESWHLVKNTPKVTGFLGSKIKPTPISEAEASRLISQLQEGSTLTKTALKFEIGELIKVSDGPFASFNGVVEEIDEDKARLKVSVTIFGRATPVDLDFTQVEKA
jgi:transcriptional antiterminator NusG